LVAEVTFCSPMSARGQTRREVARRARRAIATALAIHPTLLEPERPAPRVARPSAVNPAPQAVVPAPPRGLADRWQAVRNALGVAHGSVARG
jgi:hypothetical protein